MKVGDRFFIANDSFRPDRPNTHIVITKMDDYGGCAYTREETGEPGVSPVIDLQRRITASQKSTGA